MEASDKFEMFMSSDKGRGLRAKLNKIPKSTLLLSTDPFVYVLCKSQKGVRCDNCFKKQSGLLRCSQCKYMRYCNKSCQKSSWSQHKKECEALKRVAPKIPPDFVILLSRVLWKLENSMDNNQKEDLVSIMDLESNYSRLTEEQKEDLGQFVIILHSYWGQGNLPMQTPDIKALLELCAKLKNNCFSLSEEEFRSNIGVGVYLSCSLLNHDCNPNCVAVFNGLHLNVRALRDIAPHEELTISYIDQMAPSFDRQKELKNVYSFDCTCERCLFPNHDHSMLVTFNKPTASDGKATPHKSVKDEAFVHIKHVIAELDDLAKEGDYVTMDQITTEYLSMKVFPVHNIYMTKILDYAMDACINLSKYKAAVNYGKITLQSYQKYLAESHPLIGLQSLRIGNLQIYLNNEVEGRWYLQKALDILQITHGPDSPLVKELNHVILMGQCNVESNSK